MQAYNTKGTKIMPSMQRQVSKLHIILKIALYHLHIRYMSPITELQTRVYTHFFKSDAQRNFLLVLRQVRHSAASINGCAT